MENKLLGMLGLMRRASALELGIDQVTEAAGKGKVKILLLPSDATAAAKKCAEICLRGRNTELIELRFPEKEIAQAVGLERCSILGVSDLGFANAFMKQLSSIYPEQYASQAEAVNARLEKLKRRKAEKPRSSAKSMGMNRRK